MQAKVLDSGILFAVIAVFRNVLGGLIIDIDGLKFVEMYDAGKRCGDFGEGSDIEDDVDGHWWSAVRLNLFDEVAGSILMQGVSCICDLENGPGIGSFKQIVVNDRIRTGPVIAMCMQHDYGNKYPAKHK